MSQGPTQRWAGSRSPAQQCEGLGTRGHIEFPVDFMK